MNYEITKGNPELYEDIIDFGNYVFNLDFPSMLPKLYMNHSETSRYHHIVMEDQRIKAMVGCFPLGLTVCGNSLNVKGIGTVSVHKYRRHSGYMRILMNRALEEMKSEGCDLAVLGGQRQRYEYWGFTTCGIVVNLNFNRSNIKHCNIEVDADYKFKEYDNSLAGDLEKAVKLHDSQPVHADRNINDFIEITKSWHSNVIFLYKDGGFIGYLTSSGNHDKILEIVLTNPSEVGKVVVSYMKRYDLNNLNVDLPTYRTTEFMELSRFCEYHTIKHSANINILHYKNVLSAFMKLKNSLSPLKDGVLILNIEDRGRFRIEVRSGIINVTETDAPYDLSFSHLEASSLLFSQAGFFYSAFTSADSLIKSWFPLPLFYPELDNV